MERTQNALSMDMTTKMSPKRSSPIHPSSGGEGGFGRPRGGGGAGRGRVTGQKDFIGSTIKIIRGPFKGNIGTVKDATQATARIELHTSRQTIFVGGNRISDVGTPSHDSGSRFGGPRGGGDGGRGRVTRQKDIIGSTIKIIRGPFKGNIGIVKDATQTTARIEL